MNLVWLGDWSRDTGFKAEAGLCWSCDSGFLVSDEHQQEDDLEEIISSHFECKDYNFTEKELARRLLDGETLDLDDEKTNLSNFLKRYSYTQKGSHSPLTTQSFPGSHSIFGSNNAAHFLSASHKFLAS